MSPGRTVDKSAVGPMSAGSRRPGIAQRALAALALVLLGLAGAQAIEWPKQPNHAQLKNPLPPKPPTGIVKPLIVGGLEAPIGRCAACRLAALAQWPAPAAGARRRPGREPGLPCTRANRTRI